jgi:cytochrome c oxidase assembly protein subunit 15
VLILGKYRPFIRVGHAALAQTFFMLVITLAVVTSRWWLAAGRSDGPAARGSLRRVALLTTIVLFGQLMLGAAMRHTESGLALTEFPASYSGGFLPPTDADGMELLNEDRDFDYFFEPVTMGQVWVNFAHRAAALVVVLAVARMALFVLRRHADEPRFVSPAILLAGLLVMQIVLGIATVTSLKNVWVTTLHVGTGVFMFAQSFNLTLRAYRLVEPSQPADRMPAVELGVAAS